MGAADDADLRGRHALLAELLEGLHDADHGAEQADERRVVAERAEVREASLELHALQRGRALHGFVRGLHAAIAFTQPGHHHRGFGARGRFELTERGFGIALSQQSGAGRSRASECRRAARSRSNRAPA